MALNAYSILLTTAFLDGSTTVIASPISTAATGVVGESFIGMPLRVAGSASAVNVKLNTLTNPLWLAVYAEAGISFQISSGGDAIEANPFAFISDVTSGLGISEIWLTNSEAGEIAVTVLAGEE